MKIVFYRAASGKEPVREYFSTLPLPDRAAAADVLDAIREHGLNAAGVRFRPIRGKLWEFHVEAKASHRIFYLMVTGPMMVLLHSYKKQSQKAPNKEIKIAERRMKEVFHES